MKERPPVVAASHSFDRSMEYDTEMPDGRLTQILMIYLVVESYPKGGNEYMSDSEMVEEIDQYVSAD